MPGKSAGGLAHNRANNVMGYSTIFLKQRYEQMPEYLALLDNYVQKITSEAYHNVYLLSNQVLSRNPHENNFFRKLLFQERVQHQKRKDILKRLAAYYYRSSVQFIFYLATWLVLRIVSQADRSVPDSRKTLYVIDTFVLVENVLREQEYQEKYFPGLYEVLEKYDKQFVVLPRFYGVLLNPRKALTVTRLLHNNDYSFVTEFQLLRFPDLLRVLGFILRYPIDVLVLASRVSQNEIIDCLFVSELRETIEQVTFNYFIRFLVGRRLGEITDQKINLISWCENQVIDKNLYRGVRETARDVFIYGSQCFIGYPALLNSSIAETEMKYNVTPSRVLVNGEAYLRNDSAIAHRLGVSFRYRMIFSKKIDWDTKIHCVIFLSYIDEFSADILKLCVSSSILKSQMIVIRPHIASFPPKNLTMTLPDAWMYTEQDAYKLIEVASIVITSESGTAVEAAALGTSVIIVASQSSFTCNPMLETGRGKIWDIVFDTQELDRTYSNLLNYRYHNVAEIRDLAKYYRDVCFVEPTEDNIVRAFELDV